jgi:hypothetical protein
VILLAVCEIAFATQLVFESFDALSWRDLHPGWRLARCLEGLASVPLPRLRPGSADYDRYVDALCRLQTWPGPSRICRHVLDHAPAPQGVHDRLFQKACGLRVRVPMIVVHPQHEENWDLLWRELLNELLPGSALGGGVHRFLAGTDRANMEYLQFSFVTRAAQWLMFGGPRGDLLPAWFREMDLGGLGPEEHEERMFSEAFGFSLDRVVFSAG